MPDVLRTIDFGTASPLRSQTLWHAIAYGVSEGSPPTLSFVRPSHPYVGIGYHRRIDEVNVDLCRDRGWPVYRRMVGGGPVFLDSGQLFFQITVPMTMVPASRPKALRWLLEPAADAFRDSGVDARVDDHLELAVGDQKICGSGAGQIEQAAIVVGNLIETFDHAAAASVLRHPSAIARDELARLVEQYVAPTPIDPATFMAAAVERYASLLGLDAVAGSLSDYEHQQLAALDTKFEDPHWINGATRPAPAAWQVKVKAGVFVFAAERNGTELTLGVEHRRILRVDVVDAELNGTAHALATSLVGLDLDEASTKLNRSGAAGRRLSELLSLAEPGRL